MQMLRWAHVLGSMFIFPFLPTSFGVLFFRPLLVL